MGPWLRFFIGTPARFIRTAVAVLIAIAAINPSIATRMLDNVLAVFLPLLQPVLAIAIVFYGIKLILGGGKR